MTTNTARTPGLPPLFIRTNRHTSTDGHAWGWLDTAPPGSAQKLLDDHGLRIEWNGSKGLQSAAFIVRAANSHEAALAELERLHALHGHAETAAVIAQMKGPANG